MTILIMSKLPLNIRPILDAPYALSDEQIQSYRTNGFVKLKDVLSPELVVKRFLQAMTTLKNRGVNGLIHLWFFF
jgi:hypothetical protein